MLSSNLKLKYKMDSKRPYSLVTYSALVLYRMVQLCRPYGEGITCLCDEKDHVLKCFLETSNPTPQVLISL